MDIEVTADTSRVTAEQIAAINGALGFGTADFYMATPDFLSRLFGPGVFGFFAIDPASGQPAGFLRALSDGYIVAWIAELCVLPEYQRKGIGTALLEAASARFADLALYADPFDHNFEFFTKRGLPRRPILIACARGPVKRAGGLNPLLQPVE